LVINILRGETSQDASEALPEVAGFQTFARGRISAFANTSCYFAGAIATELSHDDLKVNPFIPIVLLWIGAFIRDRSVFF